MLSDRANQAKNVIMQQVQVLLEDLNTQSNTIATLTKYNNEYELVHKELRANPDIGTEGWYQNKLSAQYAEIITLREDLKKWKEFGKLKDRAKLKVEGDRDYYRMRMNEIAKHLHSAENRAKENLASAQAYDEERRQNEILTRKNERLTKKVEKLSEILEAGLKGLRQEQARRDREGYW